jgi:hypothetical protein
MDLNPYIFKTTNYGETWTKITNGLNDPHGFVRVVREDKKVKGLLYAGTETGLYVSFDDGQNWQDLQLNLPIVPINDLIIQDNDLVAATAGRSFWILDDLAPIQNVKTEKQEVSIFKPKDSYLILGGSTSSTPGVGTNPKSGVTFDYYLAKKVDSLELKLEVLQNGKVIRNISSKKPKGFKSWPGGPSKPEVLPAKKGYNRFTWNFTKDPLPSVDNVFVFGGYSGSIVPPGNYTLRLSLEENTVETVATVLQNPKVKASKADIDEQQMVLAQIEGTVRDIHESVNNMRSAKSQLRGYAKLLKDNDNAKDLLAKGKKLIKRIETWERNLIQPDQKTFQDVINFNNKLNAKLMHLRGFVDVAEPKVTEGAKQLLNDLLAQWKTFKDERNTIINTEMADYNNQFKNLSIPALIIKN